MSVCKCGRQILWGVTAEGKKIPLDPKAPVYAIVEIKRGVTEVCRTGLSMVTHFATCPNANEFSGSKKKD